MKRYFQYQLKNNSRAIIIITVLMILISFFVSIETMSREHKVKYAFDGKNTYWINDYYYGEPESYIDDHENEIKITDETIITRSYHDLSLTYPVIILVLLSIVVPAWMFGFMKKKRNLDCLYSLPITKRGIGITQYTVGIIATYVPFIFSYAVMLICNASYGLFGNIAHKYIILHFLICLIAGFVIYSLCSFAFDRANTIIDGIIMIGIYLFVLYFVAFSIGSIINKMAYFSYRAEFDEIIKSSLKPSILPEQIYLPFCEERGIPFVAFIELLDILERDAELVHINKTAIFLGEPENAIWIIIWCVIGFLSACGVIYGFGKKKAESAEEISCSIFCYKLIIPVTFILLNVNYAIFRGDTTACIAMTVACVIAYTIYRRGIRYKASDYIVMGIMLLLTICSLFVYSAIIESFVYDPYSGILWD